MSGILAALAGIKTAIATAVDEYFNRVTLLLNTSSTNGAQNNTFLDSSTNNFTITRNGNTTQGTFTPFSQTGWGNYFKGSTPDYLTAGSNAAYQFGTNSYTIEFWMFHSNTAASGDPKIFQYADDGNYTNGYGAYMSTTTNTINFAGPGAVLALTGTVAANSWNHIAIVRNSSTTTLYINGVSASSGADSANYSYAGTYPFAIGSGRNASGNWAFAFTGYISNFRVVKGTAVYTSAFTPPTTPLTAISGTSLLTCQSNRFLDNSTNAFAITATGTPSVQAFSPFAPTAAYDTAVVGGSGYFDGTGDYLTAADNAAFAFGTGNFSIELFAYRTNSPSGVQMLSAQTDNASAAGTSYSFYLNTNTIESVVYSGSTAYTVSSSGFVTATWTHLAVVRTGSTLSLFANGARIATTSIGAASVNDAAQPLSISARSNGTDLFTGYISGFRVVKGSGSYDATQTSITVPTAPPTAITNTSLLLNYTNAGIYDSASKNVLETVGNAQVSTTQAKWGTTSMYFDGTGDYLNAGKNEMFSIGSAEDFTFEAWIYAASVSDVSVFGIGSSTFFAYRILSGSPYIYVQTTGGLLNSGTISANTWTHIAITRSSGTLRSFINGTQAASVANTGSFSASAGTGAGVYVGAANLAGASTPGYVFNGYIDDMRFTKGYARYTSNFTAPTSALPLQ